jgi:hypothetical protein
VLSSQEQHVWDDVQRFWATEAEEPSRLAPSALGTRWVWDDPEDLPVVVAAGVWLAIALVVFGAVLAGLAVLAVTAAGWALWRNWPRDRSRQVARSAGEGHWARDADSATRYPEPRPR